MKKLIQYTHNSFQKVPIPYFTENFSVEGVQSTPTFLVLPTDVDHEAEDQQEVEEEPSGEDVVPPGRGEYLTRIYSLLYMRQFDETR